MKMELMAALLHSPEVLFLDEPTIGLDVVAQHNIQSFLKHYQQARRVTVLLTSHYMKDVVALCRRVVIIALGQIVYDGSLSGIIDRFGGHKIISLEMLNGETPTNLGRYGELLSSEPLGSSSASSASWCPRCLAVSSQPLGSRRQRRRSAHRRDYRRDVFADRHGQCFTQRRKDAEGRPVISRAATWWTILRISLEERLVYRGDFALGTLMRFLPIVTQVFLWAAVFSAMESAGGGQQIAGYSYRDMIAYYLLTMISRAFSSMPGLATGIARDIRDGTIKKYLIQPIDMLGFLLLYRLAHKLVYYVVAAAPFALVFYLCRGYFAGWPNGPTLLAFALSLVMSFLLGFFLEATLGMMGFWFLEVNSLLFVYMLLNFFFSGHMFPIDMLPGVWAEIVKQIPLQYLAYFPAAVFLGKVSGPGLLFGLCTQFAWVVFFMIASRAAFHLGTRRYSGYGG